MSYRKVSAVLLNSDQPGAKVFGEINLAGTIRADKAFGHVDFLLHATIAAVRKT